MRRRVLLCFVLALASGCKGDEATKPTMTSAPPPPSRTVSDGNHNGGNKDFFFLPPMVANPSGSPNWDATGFDGSFVGAAAPNVRICRLDATSADAVATSRCTNDPGVDAAAVVDLTGELYQLNWKVPDVSTITFYRIFVVLRTNQLGMADLEVVPSASQLKNLITDDVVPLADNRTLPIKFRIEQGALSQAVVQLNLKDGGQVSTVLPGSSEPSGVFIPAQGGDNAIRTITVTACESLNSRATDLPVFGPCVSVKSEPALTDPLASPATVFICDVDETFVAEEGVTDEEQAHRITLHQLDVAPDNTQILKAVPHAAACAPSEPGGPELASASTLGGMLADLGHGNLKAAARRLANLVAPKSLHAAMFIDLGGGGRIDAFSDFQFALPAKMEIVGPSQGSHVSVGPVEATVRVTDLGGEPVNGATVHFFTADPATSNGVTSTSGTNDQPPGIARVPWNISFGDNALAASGRGIAGPDFNGPRGSSVASTAEQLDNILDPFQPIQSSFDPDATPSGSVIVRTGSVTFSTVGIFGFEATEPSWVNDATRGFWHVSALTGLTNTVYPALVDAATGDNSSGALPGPFDGNGALWFGNETGDSHGNYAGVLASTDQSGGTSAQPHGGVAVSPIFTVPDTPNGAQLTFRSWFEIESVNPSRFDVMQVTIHDLDTDMLALLTRLNPAADPGTTSAKTPFTSGGFNLPPVWNLVTSDLTPYRGHRVQVTFSFDTVDQLYNGFRGWIVDDVRLQVLSAPVLTTRIPIKGPSFDVIGTEPPPARSWRP